MEYVQMTLDDWVQMKQKLKQELLGVKQSFVRIGYALRQIDDQKLYEQDGYKSIAEFAQAEYGLGPSITSRFMSINREYSIDGYSEQLRPEYAELGRSQLEEMLKLPDADRQMIQPETSREDIRELKRFNKTEPAAGVADDISQLVEKFYQDNELILNAVYGEEFDEQTINRFIEIVNPAGNRSYKKGLYFMMMYENRVTFKKFGDTPKDMTWWEFYQLTREIFDDTAAGTKTWQNHFGGADDEESTVQDTADEPGREENATEAPKPEDDGGAVGETGADDVQEIEKGGITMFLSTSVLNNLMKKAYKTGLVVARTQDAQGNDWLYLAGSYWEVSVNKDFIPKKTLGDIITLIGELPRPGERFKATKEGNQIEIEMPMAINEEGFGTDTLTITDVLLIGTQGTVQRLLQDEQTGQIYPVNNVFVSIINNAMVEEDKGEYTVTEPLFNPFRGILWKNNVCKLRAHFRTDDKNIKVLKSLKGVDITPEVPEE